MKPIEKFKPYIIGATVIIYFLVASKYFGWFFWAPDKPQQNNVTRTVTEFKPRENTFKLPANFNDPFGTPTRNRKMTSTPNNNTINTTIRRTVHRQDKLANAPQDSISYTGYIAKMPGSDEKALISVNSKRYILALNDTVDKYFLKSLEKDSIILVDLLEQRRIIVKHENVAQ